jgi:four helix bundle protein
MKSYKNLDGWKKSMQLVKEVYLITKSFPKEELYGLTSQIKRAVVSIPANIAEGLGEITKRILLNFYIFPEVPYMSLKL